MDPYQQPSPLRWVNHKEERATYADGRCVAQRHGTVAIVDGEQSVRQEQLEHCGLDCGCTVSSTLQVVRCTTCDALVCTDRHSFICSVCGDNCCHRCCELERVRKQVVAVCESCKRERERTWLGQLLRDLLGWIWQER